MSYISCYEYSGPVEEFGRCIAHEWKGRTYATTEKKAYNNLAYQFKVQHNKSLGSSITLPGDIKVFNVGGEQNE